MTSLSCRSVASTRKKLEEIRGETLEGIADLMLDAEDDYQELEGRYEKLVTTTERLVMAALGSAMVPANRIMDEDYIYDELGSELGSATNDALRLLRGEQVSA